MTSTKDIISKNIQTLRKANGLTQLEFAQKLNYSDKAVSRWEKGEAMPDVDTLAAIAKLFEISVSSLFEEGFNTEILKKNEKKQVANKTIISLLIILCTWTIAGIVYFYLGMVDHNYYWQIFFYAVPVSCLVGFIFNFYWGEKLWRYVLGSLAFWTLIAALYVSFLKHNLWPLFILCIPIQAVIILWYFLKKKK